MPWQRVFGWLRSGGRWPVDPSWGVPGSPGAPDQGLPGSPGAPDQGLPGGEYPDQGLPPGWPGRPSHPIVIPPLPGVWPPPGRPSFPTVLPELPSGTPEQPIYIEGTPEHPIALPPATIWPPLPPATLPSDKHAILIWVIGVGTRWLVWDSSQVNPTPPPVARPK